ncbi:hypothetical protein C6P46_000979 [Rhodotorula mucilaginosa]|uniref:Uncharacterized protein n=1 Tax=Rhodotorula mucilaginosa TaxID=5537 RepID=A0A9P6VW36_RHOMI|nr:hypothetical protein C6P46_000979 [Rhodotorula mucilaginosa]
MSHSGPANGAGEAARRLRHNGQYVARLQDIVNKCHDRIQLLTEGSLAEVGGSADELKQAVLAWGQTVLAPELLIQLRVKARSPIASRLEALAKEGLYDFTNSADAPQGVEPCKLGTVYGRIWDIIHAALSRAENLSDQKLREIIQDSSSRKVEVALWVERMLDPVRELMKLLLTTLTGTAKTAQFSVYPPQNQALAPPGGVHPAYAVTYAGAMGGHSPPNPPPPPPPPLPLNPLPNPHGLAGPSQVYQSIPPGSFFPITGPQANWSGHHHHVPMSPPAGWAIRINPFVIHHHSSSNMFPTIQASGTVHAVAGTDQADPPSPDGEYAAHVNDIVQACHDRLDLLKRRMLPYATKDSNALKTAVRHWAQAVLAPASLGRLATKARTPILQELRELRQQAGSVGFGETIHWPLSPLKNPLTNMPTSSSASSETKFLTS